MSKLLNKVDISGNSKEKYTTYFYHKYNKFVWEVVSDGTKCPLSIMDEVGINKQMKFSHKLPKYISNNL